MFSRYPHGSPSKVGSVFAIKESKIGIKHEYSVFKHHGSWLNPSNGEFDGTPTFQRRLGLDSGWVATFHGPMGLVGLVGLMPMAPSGLDFWDSSRWMLRYLPCRCSLGGLLGPFWRRGWRGWRGWRCARVIACPDMIGKSSPHWFDMRMRVSRVSLWNVTFRFFVKSAWGKGNFKNCDCEWVL